MADPDPRSVREARPRRLVVIRHAEAAHSGRTDAERPLTEAGADAARETGAWLARRQVMPDLALVSSARRARETWSSICRGAECAESLGSSEHALYSSGPEAVMDLVRMVGDEVQTLVVVGHNPTMSVLAMTLDDGSTSTLLDNPGFPPGAVAVFDVQGSWAELEMQGASAVDFHVGRA